MTNAVSYAYETPAEERPTLLDQFTACRAYAEAQGYAIVGEFNDIDEADHEATGAGLEATASALPQYGATVILVCQPSSSVLDRLNALGATVSTVAARSSPR